jgi:GTP cyclohydrolase I
MDLPRIEQAVREILCAVGEDPDREGLPGNAAKGHGCMPKCRCLIRDPMDEIKTFHEADHDEMVMVGTSHFIRCASTIWFRFRARLMSYTSPKKGVSSA